MPMDQNPRNRATHPEIARRLRRVREIYGPSLTDFCREYKFTVSQWSNYESGWKPTLAVAEQLVKQIDGLTLDWIYRGETGGLTVIQAKILRGDAKDQGKE
jgi:transcriptional regulator with XRE-family HTH domain